MAGLRIVRIAHFGLCELRVLVAKAVVESEVLRDVKFVLTVEIEIANENSGQEWTESLAIRLPTFTAVEVGEVLSKVGYRAVRIGTGPIEERIFDIFGVSNVESEFELMSPSGPRQIIRKLETIFCWLHARQVIGNA